MGKRGSDRDRHRRIAAHGLKHDVSFETAFPDLLGDNEAKIGVGNDDRPIK